MWSSCWSAFICLGTLKSRSLMWTPMKNHLRFNVVFGATSSSWSAGERNRGGALEGSRSGGERPFRVYIQREGLWFWFRCSSTVLMTLVINQTGRWMLRITAETTALPLTQHTCLVTKRSEGGWLRNHVVPSSQSAWLGFRQRRRGEISLSSPRLHQKKAQNDVFHDQLLITDKKFSFVGPLSSTEMRCCTRLQGDLADFNSFTPDYALEHLLCGQPAEHPLKDKASQKPVQTVSHAAAVEKNLAFLAKEAQNNYVCIHVLAPEAASSQILQPNMSSALP